MRDSCFNGGAAERGFSASERRKGCHENSGLGALYRDTVEIPE